jgi:hypothetical protein
MATEPKKITPWKHPKTGQKRWYLNDLDGVLGRTQKPAKYPMKAWLDKNKNVHHTGDPMTHYGISEYRFEKLVDNYVNKYPGVELLDLDD